MNSTIGVYKTHDDAIEALRELKNAGYNTKHVSLIGKAEKSGQGELINIAGTEVGIGALAGSAIGILTGVGLFAIPGLGFLFGAGALVGAIAGFDFGLLGGGIVSALTLSGLHKEIGEEYDVAIKQGRFLLIAQGNDEEVEKAKTILETHGKHTALNVH